MKAILNFYRLAAAKLSLLQSPFLLLVRVYWGLQFMQTGWGKMHNVPKFTNYFASLNIPFPAFNAHFVAGVEFFGGLLLLVGLASRLAGLLLAGNMLVAYWTSEHDALVSLFKDPLGGKFYAVDPYTFLFASVMVLIFGAGLFSLDALLARRMKED